MQEAELSIEPYQKVTGYLIPLMVIEPPNLLHSVCIFAKFVESPVAFLWVAMQRMMRTILDTIQLSSTYGGSGETVVCISNVCTACAGNVATKWTVNGSLIMIGGAAVCRFFQQKQLFALSGTVLEYIKLCLGTNEITWICRLVVSARVVLCPKQPRNYSPSFPQAKFHSNFSFCMCESNSIALPRTTSLHNECQVRSNCVVEVLL